MTPFAINLMLAVAWQALTGDFSLIGLLVGFTVGYLVLWLLQPVLGENRYCAKLLDQLMLVAFFLYELVVSSVRVAWYVLAPKRRSRPGIIAVPLETCTDTELTVLANLVSLTPGSLSLDISEDRRTLLVHAMFVDDPELERSAIKSGMERRVLEAMRR